MTTVNANVTAGKVWTPDANGEVQVTPSDLNAAAVPTATVDLSGKVDSEDIVAAAVTAAKLADAVADYILAAALTVGDSVAKTNPIDVTLQVQDIQGNNLATRCAVWFWLADGAAAGGDIPPTSTLPDQAHSFEDGAYVVDLAADTVSLLVTDASGTLKVRFQENGGALTRYAFAIVGNRLIEGSQALIWT